MLPLDVIIIGSYNQDHFWKTPQFPAVGESRIGTFATGPGGKGFNQAVAAHRQGVKTVFLGAIGDDSLGDVARKFAAKVGVGTEWEVHAGVSTGASSIVVDEKGDNLICVALGANERLSREFVRNREKLIGSAKIVVCQLENRLGATEEALMIGRESGNLTILNPAPINELVTLKLLTLADILTPNETEFAFLMKHLFGKQLPPDYWQLDDGLLHLLCRETQVPTVVITLGDKGCFVSHDPMRRRGDEQAFYRLPTEQVSVVDTTGAGDAFTGGLAAGMILYHYSEPFSRAVRHAGRVAGLSIERPGTAPAMPTRPEVDARFPD